MPSAALLMMVQAATLPPASDDPLAHFDLAKVKSTATGCAPGDLTPSEIIVCGKKDQGFRIDRDPLADQPVDFSTRLLGADVRPVAVQRSLPGGLSSPAIMLNFKWKF